MWQVFGDYSSLRTVHHCYSFTSPSLQLSPVSHRIGTGAWLCALNNSADSMLHAQETCVEILHIKEAKRYQEQLFAVPSIHWGYNNSIILLVNSFLAPSNTNVSFFFFQMSH